MAAALNAKAINHGRFKWERLVKESLHSGPQTANRSVSLPLQYQAIQRRVNHREYRKIQERGFTRSTYVHTDGRSTYTRAEFHATNNACKGTDNGHGRTNTRQTPSLFINRLKTPPPSFQTSLLLTLISFLSTYPAPSLFILLIPGQADVKQVSPLKRQWWPLSTMAPVRVETSAFQSINFPKSAVIYFSHLTM